MTQYVIKIATTLRYIYADVFL